MTTPAVLIRDAYILAHVINPQESVDGSLLNEGLRMLNEILAQWGALGIYIPYTQQVTYNIVSPIYTYPDNQVIAQILEANMIDNSNVLYPLRIANDEQFNLFNYTTPMVTGRPEWVYLSRQQFFPDPSSSSLGSLLYVYPTPDANYTMNLLLKYNLGTLTINEEILELPPYYMKPLRYQLAKDLISLHGSDIPQTFFDEYENLMRSLYASNPLDMSVQNENPFYQIRRFRPWGYYVG